MRDYKIINATQISREKWWEFTDNNENCNIFSTPYMYDVWNATPGYKSFAFFAIDENEDIKGLLVGHLETVSKGLLSKLSTRAVLMQSPVALDDDALSLLLNHYLYFMKRRAVYTEIRNNFDTLIQRNIYESLGFNYEDHLNILIDLFLDEEELWKNLHANRKTNIKKAKKYGIIVKQLEFAELSESIAILQQLYKKINLPFPPYNFFEFAYKTTNNKTKMIAYGAYFENKIIGTMITLHYKGTVLELYVGSLDKYYTKYPNDVLPWDIMLLCKQEGYKWFDFGGAGNPNISYGVRDFKIKYGGEIVNFGRYYFYHSKPLFKMAETGFKSLQKINSIKSRIQNFNYQNS